MDSEISPANRKRYPMNINLPLLDRSSCPVMTLEDCLQCVKVIQCGVELKLKLDL